MAFKSLQKDLKLEIDEWYKQSIINDSNPSFSASLISWQDYRSGGSLKGDYASVFNSLSSNRQYTIKFEDESFVQIYLEAKEKVIVAAKYAYYPLPSDSGHSSIRIDYSKAQYKPCFHPLSHFQVGSCNDVRFPSDELPRPEVFLEFIVRGKYQEAWRQRFPMASSYISKMEEMSVDLQQDFVDQNMATIRLCDLYAFYDKYQPFSAGLCDWSQRRALLFGSMSI